MLEVVITTAIMMVFLSGLSLMIRGTHSLRGSEEERRLAETAIQSAAEEVRAVSSVALASSTGWAPTLIASLGNGDFDVPGLTPPDGVASVGTVQFVLDETTTDAALGIDLGMPRDLDDDGLASSLDVTATAVLIPVVVRVQWTGVSGQRQIIHGFHMLGYK